MVNMLGAGAGATQKSNSYATSLIGSNFCCSSICTAEWKRGDSGRVDLKVAISVDVPEIVVN
jgi:hypothetical protein